MGGWMDIKAILRMAYSNQKVEKSYIDRQSRKSRKLTQDLFWTGYIINSDGRLDGWMDGLKASQLRAGL